MGARQRQKLLKRRKAVASSARSRSRTRSVAVTGTMITAAAAALGGVAPAQAGPVEVTPRMVADLVPGTDGSDPREVVAAGGTTFFTAVDGDGDRELWKTDGTAAGAQRVADINTTGSSYPQNLTAVGGTLFFTAQDDTHGRELWRSDGTEAGTTLVKDVNPGSGSGAQNYSHGYGNSQMTAIGDTLFFPGYQGATGRELWKSDGTEAGTTLVKDINAGYNWGLNYANGATAVGDTLFFTAYQDGTGTELWKSDGTESGTTLVKDIRPGANSSQYYYNSSMSAVGGTLFLSADDGTHGRELWTSDGTEAGTTLVKDINPGYGSGVTNNYWYGNYGAMVATGGALYFSGQDGTSGVELWKSDGTEAGTALVVDANPGRNGSYPREITAVGTSVFYSAENRVSGRELWKSDGTSASMVADIAPGTFSGYPYALAEVAGRLWFTADNGMQGRELWTSDGTRANTSLAADIRAGVEGSEPRWITDIHGKPFFAAYTDAAGQELWTVDVAPAATPTPTPPATFTAPAPVDDAVRGAVVKVKAPQRQGKKVRVVVRTTASEAVTATGGGVITIAGSKKAITLRTRSSATTGSGDVAKLQLRVGKKAQKKVLRAVQRYRDASAQDKKKFRVKARVSVVIADEAGNRVVRNVVVKLV